MNIKYKIRKAFWHKQHVLLLSVVPTLTGTSAIWSTHEHGWDIEKFRPSTEILSIHFQREHERQVDVLIQQEYLNEPEQFKTKTVDDISETTRDIVI